MKIPDDRSLNVGPEGVLIERASHEQWLEP